MNAKTKNNIEEIKEKVISIFKKHGIPKAILFGSYVYDDMDKDSDIDIYIDLPKNRRLGYEFFDIAEELESKLNKKVDLIECSVGNPPIKQLIMKEGIIIYECKNEKQY